jgi:hypothetical protein
VAQSTPGGKLDDRLWHKDVGGAANAAPAGKAVVTRGAASTPGGKLASRRRLDAALPA